MTKMSCVLISSQSRFNSKFVVTRVLVGVASIALVAGCGSSASSSGNGGGGTSSNSGGGGITSITAAVALVGSLIPTTLAGHRFWSAHNPAVRAVQRIQFHKNMAMIGGLLFAVLDDTGSHVAVSGGGRSANPVPTAPAQ